MLNDIKHALLMIFIFGSSAMISISCLMSMFKILCKIVGIEL